MLLFLFFVFLSGEASQLVDSLLGASASAPKTANYITHPTTIMKYTNAKASSPRMNDMAALSDIEASAYMVRPEKEALVEGRREARREAAAYAPSKVLHCGDEHEKAREDVQSGAGGTKEEAGQRAP